MKKRNLVVMLLLGMALVTGCGGGKSDDSRVTTPTGIDSTVSESEEVENTEASNSETDESVENVVTEDNMDYSVFKAPDTTSDDAGEYVVMYGMIGDYLEDGSYEVYTANGVFVFKISDDTIMEDGVELVTGTYVEVINTGIVTMSLPGQIANVLEVKVVNAEDVLVEGRTIDELYNVPSVEDSMNVETQSKSVYPEVEYSQDGTEVIFYGEVVSIDESDDTLEYTVDTNNGVKIFNVGKNLVTDGIEVGTYVKAVTDGIETRSIPGILSGVSVFEVVDVDTATLIESNKASLVDKNDINASSEDSLDNEDDFSSEENIKTSK